jgi:hypothetical protein
VDIVLGDQGTYFTADGTQLVAVNQASGAEQWRWRPNNGSTVQIIAATAGGGVAVRNILQNSIQEDVVRLDSTGTPTSDAWGTAGGSAGYSVLSNSTYITNGLWVGVGGTAVVAELKGDLMDVGLTDYAYSGGNEARQNKKPIPSVKTYVPFQIDNPGQSQYTPSHYAADMRSAIPASVAHLSFELLGTATYPKFMGDVQSRNFKAVGYVGHSYEPQGTSVGICFAINDSSQPQWTSDCIIQSSQRGLFNPGTEVKPEYVDKISTQAKVIYIAACATDTIFRLLWDTTDGTKGKAIILPNATTRSQPVNLVHGAVVWQIVAYHLSQGETVQASVAAGNVVANSQNFNERWTFIGDGNVRIAPQN